MHIGSSSQMVITSDDAPIDCLITLTPINIVQAATDLIWSPIFRKFPDMRIALSEGGIGWIPYFLERIDYQYRQHHTWTGQDFGDRLPSEVFDEHVLTCFIDDRFGVASRNFLNMDNVMWECDYPHSDSTWPFSPEELGGYLDGVSDHDVDRITPRQRDAPLRLRPLPAARWARELHGRCTTGQGGRSRRLHPVDQAEGGGHRGRAFDGSGGQRRRRPLPEPAEPRGSGKATTMLFAMRFDMRNPAARGHVHGRALRHCARDRRVGGPAWLRQHRHFGASRIRRRIPAQPDSDDRGDGSADQHRALQHRRARSHRSTSRSAWPRICSFWTI